jgi:hypothetical protein
MQTVQAKILYSLLGISIKQGRAVEIGVPAPSRYLRIVKDLLLFHEVHLQASLEPIKKALDKADNARNILAHSVFLNDKQTGELKIQIVRGAWELERDVVSVSRALQPEGRRVNRAFLKEQRAAVENGIREINRLARVVHRALEDVNSLRQSTHTNRRREGKRAAT